jgi:phage anti-repressor protein
MCGHGFKPKRWPSERRPNPQRTHCRRWRDIDRMRQSTRPLIAEHARLNFEPCAYAAGNGRNEPMYQHSKRGQAMSAAQTHSAALASAPGASPSIPIEAQRVGDEERAVLASKLHAGLGIGKDFTNWIKAQVKRAMLTEGLDFVVLAQKGGDSLLAQKGENSLLAQKGENSLLAQKGEQKTGRGGHNRLEYLLTLDAAKHIAMLAHTERGAVVRRYFIEAEKELQRRGTGTGLQAAERLGRLERDRELIESAGSAAGRTLGKLRRIRRASDEAMASELRTLQAQLPGLEGGTP